MTLDELMRTALREVAETEHHPQPDVTALQRRGRRTRLFQVAGAATAVATLIVAGGVSVAEVDDQQATGPSSPDSTAHAPALVGGSPPVWRTRGGVRVGPEYLVVQGKVKTGPTLVAAGVVYTDERDEVFMQTLDGKTSSIGKGARLGAVGDPRGSAVAWFDESSALPNLVVYDTAADEVLARVDVGVNDFEGSGGQATDASPIFAVTGGAVYYRSGSDALMRYRWDKDDFPNVYAATDQVIDVAGDVTARMDTDVVFTRPDGSYFRPDPGLFRIDGTPFRAEGSLEPRGSLSSDGRYFLGRVDKVPVIIDTGTGDGVKLHGADRGVALSGAWSYGSTLMLLISVRRPGDGLTVDSSPLLMLSCDLEAVECRVVENFPGSQPGRVGDYAGPGLPVS